MWPIFDQRLHIIHRYLIDVIDEGVRGGYAALLAMETYEARAIVRCVIIIAISLGDESVVHVGAYPSLCEDVIEHRVTLGNSSRSKDRALCLCWVNTRVPTSPPRGHFNL